MIDVSLPRVIDLSYSRSERPPPKVLLKFVWDMASSESPAISGMRAELRIGSWFEAVVARY